MPVIDLSPEQKKHVRRVILFRPVPARRHRKAVILYQLSRREGVEEIVRRYRLDPRAVSEVLEEFRAGGLEQAIGLGGAAHRESLSDVEKRAPGRDKFRAMLGRCPAPDEWLDDEDDWDL